MFSFHLNPGRLWTIAVAKDGMPATTKEIDAVVRALNATIMQNEITVAVECIMRKKASDEDE